MHACAKGASNRGERDARTKIIELVLDVPRITSVSVLVAHPHFEPRVLPSDDIRDRFKPTQTVCPLNVRSPDRAPFGPPEPNRGTHYLPGLSQEARIVRCRPPLTDRCYGSEFRRSGVPLQKILRP